MPDSHHSLAPELPLPDWRLGAEVRPIFGMTLLQGCLLLCTTCILVFFWVGLSHLRALDRDADASRALIEAGDCLEDGKLGQCSVAKIAAQSGMFHDHLQKRALQTKTRP